MIKSILLMFVSIFLFVLLGPIGLVMGILSIIIKPKDIVYRLSTLFMGIAISIDQLGNVILGPILNIIRKKGGYDFGNEDDTISYVLGINYKQGTLNRLGLFVVNILDTIEKDHCINATK